MRAPIHLVTLLAVSLGALAAGPRELAAARWDALLKGDVPALVGAYVPGATAFLAGTPETGFISGEALADAWKALFEAVRPLSLKPEEIREFGENFLFARLELEAEVGGASRKLPLIWAVASDGQGRVTEEDFLLYGLPDVPQPPAVDGIIEADEYPHATSAADVSFRWLNGTLLLFGAMEAPGTGWVAVGLDPDFAMKGANMIFAWVEDGSLTVQDHYGSSPTGHRADKTDDILAAAGTESDGRTAVEFVIPLDSGDPQDKPLERGKTYRIILAYHRTFDGMRKHTSRGKAEMTLD